MSGAAGIVRNALDQVFAYADDASYIPPEGGTPVPCRAVLDPEVQTFADDRRTVSASGAPQAWLLVSEIPQARRGGQLVIEGRRFTLGRRTYADGHQLSFDVVEEA